MSGLSLGGRALPVALGVIGLKRRMQDPAALGREMDRARLHPRSPAPPCGVDRGVDVAVAVSEGGWQVYTVRPRRPPAASAGDGRRRRAVYLHGGSCIHEITRFHWMLIANLARTTDTEMSVPIYPLAPMGTASSVVPVATDLVEAMCRTSGPENAVLVGDGLGRLTVFAGTRDILQPDARRLQARAAGMAGTEVELHELEGGIHVYPLLPIPEGKAARRIIRATLTRH